MIAVTLEGASASVDVEHQRTEHALAAPQNTGGRSMETAIGRADGAGTILDALAAAAEALRSVGAGRVELVTVTAGRITLQPTSLPDGESIARSLGLDMPWEHRMVLPGYTLWTGLRPGGLEAQVRAELRQPIGARW